MTKLQKSLPLLWPQILESKKLPFDCLPVSDLTWYWCQTVEASRGEANYGDGETGLQGEMYQPGQEQQVVLGEKGAVTL